MIWYIISAIAFATALAILVITYIRDRRYVRLKASQAMDPAVLEELDQEREEAFARRDKFKEALKGAEKNGGGNP